MATKQPSRLGKALGFTRRLVRAFFRNRGLLLAGALAYNAMLALLPLSALLMFGLSMLVDPEQLTAVLSTRLGPFLPGRGETLPAIVGSFMAHRDVVGAVTVVLLIGFSLLGVRTVKQALDIVFGETKESRQRPLLRSLTLEFALTMAMVVALALLTGLALALDALSDRQLTLMGIRLSTGDAWLFEILSAAGVAALIAVLYVTLAPRRVRWRSALATGAVVAAAWQPVEALLAWFFENVSVVGVLYGSVAGLVIGMLSLEVGAIMFLLGAQALALVDPLREDRSGSRPTGNDVTATGD